MLNWMIRLFVKDAEQVRNTAVRSRYGVLAGATGIFLNLCLFAAKFLAGVITASIAITADAFNNLSDAGSSVVTLLGFKLAGTPPDKQHPFGHGRIEYLSGLAVSMAIMLVGIELAKSSWDKIMHPQAVTFSLLPAGILLVSVAVKLWMCYFNRSLAKRIDSPAMHATAMDSLTDAVATSAVLIGMLVGHFTGWMLDGYIGAMVAVFIIYTGINTAKDSLSPLLGQAPDRAFVDEIEETVMVHPDILGIHDLIVHDYGPGRLIISLHAEVPSTCDLLDMHDTIDRIELELREKYQCDATIHMDPIVMNDEETNHMRQQVVHMLARIDAALTMHDFRMVKGPTHTNLIFDVMVPYQFRLNDETLSEALNAGVKEIGGDCFAVFRLDRAFV